MSGVTEQGFVSKSLPEIKYDLESAMRAEFGEINTQAQSVMGQLIGVFAKTIADIWENMEDVYQSQYPSSADGVSLDNVVQINGITRLDAAPTTVICVCSGYEGSLISSGSLVQIPETLSVFYNPADATITKSAAVFARVQVEALSAQSYGVTINSVLYFYSRPKIIFDEDFVSGNVIAITVNDTRLDSVTYSTDQATTMQLLCDKLEAFTGVSTATYGGTGNRTIFLDPTLGAMLTVDSISITGGSDQTDYTLAFSTPDDNNAITENLTAIINANLEFITATDNEDGSLSLQSDDEITPFDLNEGENLETIERSSPVLFYSEDDGLIAAPENSITQILTPQYGWNSVNNPIEGELGRNIETDSELRLRRQNSLFVLGAGTVGAIRSRILQNVTNVESCLVFENISLSQADIEIVLNENLVSGNDIDVMFNDNSLSTITYASSHLATMEAIAAEIALQDNVSSAVVGGDSNRTITISFDPSTINEVNSFVVTGGSTQAQAIFRGGRPPKSFEAVVQGGLSQDIGEQIWLTKPAGIQSYGTTSVLVIDSQGDEQSVSFSRPTQRYIWATLELTLYSEEEFPSNGTTLVQEVLETYGNSLGIGADVLFQRVLSQIFTIPGISSGDLELAATSLETDVPSYSTSNISIGESEISVWDLGRIIVTVAP